jgi:WXG100 family type VII secretion target
VPGSTIKCDHDQIARIASIFRQQGQAAGQTLSRLRQNKDALESGGWKGRGASAFYREMDVVILPAFKRLDEALAAGDQISMKISQVMRQAEDDVTKLFLQILMGAALGAAAAAAAGSGEAAGSRQSRQDRRTDRRVDRRARSDERWRRPAGGRRGGSHLDYDWAGGAILERYLTGGGDWNIRNDPRWTQYMQSNPTLTEKLGDRAESDAQRLFTQMSNGGSSQMPINQTFPMEIENGEGVVGYQYLHGTNANAGGFQRDGTASIAPDGSGGYNVAMDMNYTWNDIIDPNPQYVTDNWKSKIADIISLGQADAYEMHIGWAERTVVNLDANGNVRSIRNE